MLEEVTDWFHLSHDLVGICTHFFCSLLLMCVLLQSQRWQFWAEMHGAQTMELWLFANMFCGASRENLHHNYLCLLARVKRWVDWWGLQTSSMMWEVEISPSWHQDHPYLVRRTSDSLVVGHPRVAQALTRANFQARATLQAEVVFHIAATCHSHQQQHLGAQTWTGRLRHWTCPAASPSWK